MRKCGILLSVSSLPSKYGIGTLGKSAYSFIDFLVRSGQTFWQILPLSPVSFGNSPYQSFSAFAFNPYYIDIQELIKDGLLTSEECSAFDFGNDERCVDYKALYNNRPQLLKKAAKRFDVSNEDYLKFCRDNEFWLSDYAFFMAYKEKNSMLPLKKFDAAVKRREPRAMELFSFENGELLQFYKITQYLFYRQWINLRKYANDNGVQIIGDIPIYVSEDSCDVWSYPELFSVDGELNTVLAAGCPPDEFSKGGQLWGNPVYNWPEHEWTGYDWWLKRMKQAYEMFDVTRIDHFRGFYSYYAVASESETAENGEWIDANGEAFMAALKKEIPDMKIIAEDLGFITPEIRSRMESSGFPGMKIIQFGFDSDGENEHLPHNFERNSVVYTGTHDNSTAIGWLASSSRREVEFALDYFDVGSVTRLPSAFIRGALSSVSDIAIIPMQDYLRQGDASRMNVPSTIGNNWTYRITHGDMNSNLADKLFRQATVYSRL